ncbi:hypothetical protein [Turneriella parva]|uniref:hypothetical protein n=1 Tax=Turneriella parva TaxID=29510 RepID=UPI0002DC5CEA|nr:hypothetical protein [Turneriella parva]
MLEKKVSGILGWIIPVPEANDENNYTRNYGYGYTRYFGLLEQRLDGDDQYHDHKYDNHDDFDTDLYAVGIGVFDCRPAQYHDQHNNFGGGNLLQHFGDAGLQRSQNRLHYWYTVFSGCFCQ